MGGPAFGKHYPVSMHARIGPFEVLRELGRGGMGVVYLARDTRLDREVAVKALPAELASDPARLERFEREARTLAQLNHPNLAGIHGVEEQDGARHLVLEYVEGESLADRLERGPLPVDEAVEYAVQIAAGLEAAHDAGVIHRDLKPANVIITPDGQAKVLDFGLARTDDGKASSAGGLDSPTMTSPPPQHSPTIEGAILGTAAYMSPEQARGRRVDKRTDIWSFGVVLYEMLVGASPFHGETATDSIGAVLHKDLELDRLPDATPENVRRVLSLCMERDRTQRLRDIGDARLELLRPAPDLDAAPVADRRPAVPLVVACTVVALGLAMALLLVVLHRPEPGRPAATRPDQAIASVGRLTDFAVVERHPTVSPDGRSIVYTAMDGGDQDIFLLRVGGSNPINLTPNSPANDFDPAFSPDGGSIAFASSRGTGGIYVMGATGEDPRRVATEGFDPAWSPDGSTLACTTVPAHDPFGRPAFGEVFLVDVRSGDRTTLEAPGPDEPGFDAVAPSWSPDGTRIVYWSLDGGQRDIFWMAAEGGTRYRLTNDAATDWDPVWGPDGRSVIFLSDRSGTRALWRLALTDDGTADGAPTPIMPGPVQIEEFAMTPDGRRLVVATMEQRGRIGRISFDVDRLAFGDDAEPLYTAARALLDLDVSHDGAWVAHRMAGMIGDDIVVARLDGTIRRRLLRDEFRDRGVQFIQDGSVLSYFSNRTGAYAIWTMNQDGTDSKVLIEDDGTGLGTVSWKRDGSALAAHRLDPPGTRIYEARPDGTVSPDPSEIEGFVKPLAWSLDGSRLMGLSELDEGILSLAVLVPETGEITFLRLPSGSSYGQQVQDARWIAWIDDSRAMGWDDEVDRVFVTDTATGEWTWVEPPLQEPVDFFKFLDDKLYYVSNTNDGDLWLVEMEAAGPAPGDP